MAMLNKEQIYETLEKYRLIKEELIILSGASLVLQEVKELTNDIDIAVSRKYLSYLLKNYQYTVEFYNYDDCFGVYYIDNIINFSTNYNTVDYIMLNGYKVQTLESILLLKEKLNRKKDKEDMKLIKKYLKK